MTSPSAFLYRYTPAEAGKVRIFAARSMIQRCIYFIRFADVIPDACYNNPMSHTLTIRLTDEPLAWLKALSEQTGLPMARIIRQQLESAKAAKVNPRFLHLAGKINGPKDLSSRAGFSRHRTAIYSKYCR